ncbi:MAG TPA: hypothetical protein VHZ97_10370 [Pseudonocardiaceae bacterium]|jgi:hypothetical protein|nr:hypothetical protein [Pseudonocardiaceae bacterium]
MTTTIRAVVALAALGTCGVLLAGCGAASAGSSPAATTPSASSASPASSTDAGSAGQYDPESVRFENGMGDCMKKAGFQYVPAPNPILPPITSIGAKDPALVPYDQLKTFRTKYGFGGMYAEDVYPNDPNIVPKDPPDRANPNNAIKAALSPAQQQAYDEAYDGGYIRRIEAAGTKTGIKMGGCVASVSAQVNPSGQDPTTDAGASARASQAEQAFTTDPTVVSDAQAYGSCLRQKGYAVPSTKPGVIEHTVSSIADQAYTNNPNPNKRQGLDGEIKEALDDLDCGKAYEAAAKPFVANLLQNGVG